MAIQLSEGSLGDIMRGEQVEEPVLQILGNKRIANSGGNERYRLLVSDGKHFNSFAMLATQLNERLTSGELSDFSVVRVKRYITSLVNSSDKSHKRVMIILELELIAPGSSVGLKLGNPVSLPEDGDAKGSARPPAPAGPAAPQGPAKPMQNGRPMMNIKPVVQQSPVRNHISESPSDMRIHPIASLNPYQNRWVIRARVFNKTPIRTWSNARGEGKLFSMDLIDESGEIRATAFKQQCDKFYDLIEVNNVYYISRCTLKTANKKFTSITHDYEMTFTDETQVIPCHEESGNIPSLSYDFMPLEKLSSLEPNSLVDVIGVCKSANEVQTLIARTTNKELKKREVLMVDQTNTGITLTLWGSQAESFDVSRHPVIAVKGGRVNEFGGAKSVSIAMSSVLQMDPDHPEAHRLRGWFDSGGSEEVVNNISTSNSMNSTGGGSWITFHEAKAKSLGFGEKPDYFSCQATVMVVKSENSLYKACPTPNCNKKVTDLQNDVYRCEKCAQEFPNFKYRLLIQAALADWTGKQWVSGFQDVAEVLLGQTADVLGETQQSDSTAYTEFFSKAAFKTYSFRLRSKCEMYNDETRLKTVMVSAQPLALKEYNKYLIDNIKKEVNMSSASI